MNIQELPIGIYEDGKTVLVNLESRNALIGGNPRSGKSVALSALLCSLCRCQNERIAVLSPKVLDFQFFAPAVRLIKEPAEMLEYLRELHDEAERRKAWCVEHGAKKITPDDFGALPHITTIIDEFTVIRNTTAEDEKGKAVKVGEQIERAIMKLVAETGFAGLSFVLATQKADGSNGISTALRDLIHGSRIHFAASTAEQTKTVMGEFAPEAPCHLITTEQRGVGYISADGLPPRPFRGALTSREDEQEAEREAERRGNIWTTRN